VTFNGTLLDKFEIEELPGESYDCVGLYGPNRCGTPNPEWRHKLRFNWTTPWDLGLAATWRYFDSVDLQGTSSNPLLSGATNPVERTLGSRNYLDLFATYNVTKSIEISGGINNVFDRDPPVTSQQGVGVGNGNTFPGVYDGLGRRVYLSASVKF
jgi:iron complex outermembrane recepter protein